MKKYQKHCLTPCAEGNKIKQYYKKQKSESQIQPQYVRYNIKFGNNDYPNGLRP